MMRLTGRLRMQLLVTVLALAATIFGLRFLGNACFDHALRLLVRLEKHTPFSRLDSYLPLQGRWLRYATAVLFTLLGVGALLAAGFAVWLLLMHALFQVVPA